MEIFTLVSLYLVWEFSLEKTDMTTENLQQYVDSIALQVGNIFEGNLDQYQGMELNQLRERNGSVMVDLSLTTLEVLGRYDDDTVFHKELESILDTGLKGLDNIVLGRPVQPSDPFSIGPSQKGTPITKYKYVFVASSFVLEEPFNREYMDKYHNNSVQIIQTIEKLLNEHFKQKIVKFQRGFVTLLRSVLKNTGVDILLTILLAEGESVEDSFIQTAVKKELTQVLSNGKLGPFDVVYKDARDVLVEQPFEGPLTPPSFTVYIVTPISIQIDTKFLIEYINISNVEAKTLTNVFEVELEQTLTLIDRFQFTEVVLLRLADEYADGTLVDLEVVSLGTYSTFDSLTLQKSVQMAVDNTVRNEKSGQRIGSYKIIFVTVFPSGIDSIPPTKKYAIIKVSVKLQTKFTKTFTQMNSNATLHLRTGIEKELKTVLAPVKEFQFAHVVTLRNEDEKTVVDINVASLTTDKLIELDLQQKVSSFMTEGVKDGYLGGQKVDSSDATAIQVDAPLLGLLPPVKLYAFTRASLQLEEPWKKVYRDPTNQETIDLTYSLELELNYGFEDAGANQLVDITDLLNNKGDIQVNFNVATLTVEDEFNATLISESVKSVMQHQVEDGIIAGLMVNPDLNSSLVIGESELGVVPTSEQDYPVNDGGFGEPGTPRWITSIVVAVCCIAGTILLVIGMWMAVRKKETVFKKEEAELSMQLSDTMTRNTALNDKDKESSSSSSSSSSGSQ